MDIALRICVLSPPPGVTFQLQRGRSELVPPVRVSATSIEFDFTVRVEPRAGDGVPRLLGPFVQGPPDGRFVYVSSGKRAGQSDSSWDRRAKVPLAGLTPLLIEKALASPGSVLEARIAGIGRDGGPACATVPLVGGWRLVPA